jgi:hypothetical protein
MSANASIGDFLGDAAAGFGELLGGWTEAVTSATGGADHPAARPAQQPHRQMAEVLSPDAGATARRFRSDMYGQLFEVRRAEGAFRPVVATAEEPPATR